MTEASTSYIIRIQQEADMRIPTSKEIRTQRNKYKMTQAACAKIIDVTDRQWRRYESGENLMAGPTWVFFCHREIWPIDPKK